MKTLYIVRGLPGSGKSTLAKKLVNPNHHCEADHYFTVDGVYNFVPQDLAKAHTSCQWEVRFLMEQGVENIAVSNTFTQRWEMAPYLEMAKKYGYKEVVIHCENDFGNVHGVPPEAIQRMKDRWQPYNPTCKYCDKDCDTGHPNDPDWHK